MNIDSKKKLIVFGIVCIFFCGTLYVFTKPQDVKLQLKTDKITIIPGDKIDYNKYIKTAMIDGKKVSNKEVEINKINNKEIGEYEIEYRLKARRSEDIEKLKVEIKPQIKNIIKKPIKNQENINAVKDKIFWVKNYSNSDECYKEASLYLMSLPQTGRIEAVYKQGSLKNPENIVGYKVKLVK